MTSQNFFEFYQPIFSVLEKQNKSLTVEDWADIFWLVTQIESCGSNTDAQKIGENNDQSDNNNEKVGFFSFLLILDCGLYKLGLLLLPSRLINKQSKPPSNITVPPKKLQVLSQKVGVSSTSNSPQEDSLSIKLPEAPAIANARKLQYALRPLKQKVFSRTDTILNEEATAQKFAELGLPIAVLEPILVRRLELAIVVESQSSIVLWQQTIKELRILLGQLGAFRRITEWLMMANNDYPVNHRNSVFLRPYDQIDGPSHPIQELLDPQQQRLLLVVSDCNSKAWHQGYYNATLNQWGRHGLVTIVQLLPRRFWEKTALGWEGNSLLLKAQLPLKSNRNLKAVTDKSKHKRGINIPVVTLNEFRLSRWSRLLDGRNIYGVVGYCFDPTPHREQQLDALLSKIQRKTPECLVASFRLDASEPAWKLATLLAPIPVDVSVIRWIQYTYFIKNRHKNNQLYPQTDPNTQVAEVLLMSGLFKPLNLDSLTDDETLETVTLEFKEGVREELARYVSSREIIEVIQEVSQLLAERLVSSNMASRLGLSKQDTFEGILLKNITDIQDDQPLTEAINYFAQITTPILRKMGGEYAQFAEQMSPPPQPGDGSRIQPGPNIVSADSLSSALPEFASTVRQGTVINSPSEDIALLEDLPDFDFQPLWVNVKILEQESLVSSSQNSENLKNLEFETVFVNKRGEINNRQKCEAYYYSEPLQKLDVEEEPREREITPTVEPLTMIYIPEGELIMGSDEKEAGQYDDETPQHRVNIAPFYMSQTPITQAQWRAIASLPQIENKLELAPANDGDNHPVRYISWHDAIEFCARLSIQTGRQYRLPSEAEWEYACRGFQHPPVDVSETDTEGENLINTKVYPPFHFGDTLTDKLANYAADETYADEPKGEWRNRTTPVRSFAPNAFGLYDMHGNIWECCLDPWHGDYKGAPSDGRVWDDENQQEDFYQDIVKNIKQLLTDERNHVFRGGSYSFNPRFCRSAFRYLLNAGADFNGFRVVCVLPRNS